MDHDLNRSLRRQESKSKHMATGKNYLLAIGIDRYTSCPPLHNAVLDAEKVVNLLTTQYAFEKEDVITLFNEEATEKGIYQAFQRLADIATDYDNVMIYFSGHGHLDNRWKMGYWVPVDATHEDTADYIANSQIITFLQGIKSRHTFLVSDSCFSGTLFYKARSIHDRVEQMPSRWGLTSGREEVVADGAPGDNSPFSRAFMDFLRTNKEEKIRVSELIHYVEEITSNNSAQTPIGSRIQNTGDKGGEFVFYKKGVTPEPIIRKENPDPLPQPLPIIGRGGADLDGDSGTGDGRKKLSNLAKMGIGGGVGVLVALSVVFLYKNQNSFASKDSGGRPELVTEQPVATEKPVRERPTTTTKPTDTKPDIPVKKPASNLKKFGPAKVIQYSANDVGRYEDYDLSKVMEKVNASSYDKTQIKGRMSFTSGNTWDRNGNSAWMTASDGKPKGEYIDFFFNLRNEQAPMVISEMMVVNGFTRTKEYWSNAARVESFNLIVNQKTIGRIYLKDTPDFQLILLSRVELPARATTHIRLEINGIYKGAKSAEVAVTEIYFR